MSSSFTICTVCAGSGKEDELTSPHPTLYGIPICLTCGGLGRVFEDAEFPGYVAGLKEFRFRYSPYDQLPVTPPAVIRHRALVDFKECLEAFMKKYGAGKPDSYASELAKGALADAIASSWEESAKDFGEAALTPGSGACALAVKRACILACKGLVDEAEAAHRAAIEAHPTISYPYADYGVFLLKFRRDPVGALVQMQKGCDQRPLTLQMAHNFVHTLVVFGRQLEAEAAVEKMLPRMRSDADRSVLRSALREKHPMPEIGNA